MRVSRLEVFGFKSFMERLVLPLDGGVTGVVGPNGCGKSNIVDSLRWVLGETRASNLRGGVLEDVIFNGTDKLRPLGLAEVTVTLKSSGCDIFSDLLSPALNKEVLDAVQLAEQLNGETSSEQQHSEGDEPRGGEGRPRLTVIPGNAASAGGVTLSNADAHNEPIADTGTADQSPISERESAEVLEQGSGDAGVNDEVAAADGDTKATVPTADLDPEAELRATLTRFAWLKSVSEVQVTRRLYRSGESEFFINRVACRLKDIKDFFRAVGLGARAYAIIAQGEVTRIVSAKPEERRLILEEAAGVLGFRDKIASATRRLDDTGVNLSRIDDVIKEVTRQVNSLKVQASRARNRQSLKEQISALDQRLLNDAWRVHARQQGRATESLEVARRKSEEADASSQRVQAAEQEARGELMRCDLECDGIRVKMDAIQDELNRRAQQRSSRSSRINELKAFALARATEIKRLENTLATLSQRENESSHEREQLSGREQELVAALGSLGPDSADELRDIARQLDQLRGRLREKDTVLRELRDRTIRAQSSIAALEEQIVAASPLNQLRETTGTRDLEALKQVASDALIFAEGLSVPAQYARAVQSYLAERAKFIVSKEPQKIARYFVDKALGRNGRSEKNGSPVIGIFTAGAPDCAITESLAEQGEKQLRGLLSCLTVSEPCRLAASRIFAGVLVADSLDQAFAYFDGGTPGRDDDTVVTLDGDIVTAWSFFSFRHEGGLIHLKRRVEDLKASSVQLEQEQSLHAGERDALQQQIRDAEARHATVLRESQERQAKMRDLSNQLGNVRGRLQAAQRLASQVVQDLSNVRRQIGESQARIQEHDGERERLEQELAALVPQNDHLVQQELVALRSEYAKLDEARKAGRVKLSSVAQQVDSARRALDAARSECARYELELQKVQIERSAIVERITAEYGEELLRQISSQDQGAEQAPILEEAARHELAAELAKLRQRVQREGEVDPTSIERYEEENRRLEDLANQRTDLQAAADTLKRTIAKLTETSERRFLATFHSIQENFSKLVPRLFGGGKGTLELLDPSRPLDSGVDIIARPPGKKLKSIELLSGGEKALCATALIFAMFLERPSPLCVLDEVDAPLDEANLVRFLTLVKEMSARTQFIMITHNKSSMSVADNLVGVTMQEPGASRIITVSLQEAYSQVA